MWSAASLSSVGGRASDAPRCGLCSPAPSREMYSLPAAARPAACVAFSEEDADPGGYDPAGFRLALTRRLTLDRSAHISKVRSSSKSSRSCLGADDMEGDDERLRLSTFIARTIYALSYRPWTALNVAAVTIYLPGVVISRFLPAPDKLFSVEMALWSLLVTPIASVAALFSA